MNLADYVDGGNLLAMEIAGIALLFLACVCATGVLLLALYFAAKLLQAFVRYAVRQVRTHAFEVRIDELKDFSTNTALGHVIHHAEWRQ